MPEPQTRTEYRVVGLLDSGLGGRWRYENGPHRTLDVARRIAETFRVDHNVRIQQHTVTETPWEDVQAPQNGRGASEGSSPPEASELSGGGIE